LSVGRTFSTVKMLDVNRKSGKMEMGVYWVDQSGGARVGVGR